MTHAFCGDLTIVSCVTEMQDGKESDSFLHTHLPLLFKFIKHIIRDSKLVCANKEAQLLQTSFCNTCCIGIRTHFAYMYTVIIAVICGRYAATGQSCVNSLRHSWSTRRMLTSLNTYTNKRTFQMCVLNFIRDPIQ